MKDYGISLAGVEKQKMKIKEWWEAAMNKNFHTMDELHTGMGYRLANAREVTEKTDLPW